MNLPECCLCFQGDLMASAASRGLVGEGKHDICLGGGQQCRGRCVVELLHLADLGVVVRV